MSSNVPTEGETEVNDELANRMSLFYAEATPTLKPSSDATTKFVSEDKNLSIENTRDRVGPMSSVCRVMLETPEYKTKFINEVTVSFCLRVMVGVIVLYDYIHPGGAFDKTSKVDVKGCFKVPKDQSADRVEGLLSALKYTTKHFSDENSLHGNEVPAAVKAVQQALCRWSCVPRWLRMQSLVIAFKSPHAWVSFFPPFLLLLFKSCSCS